MLKSWKFALHYLNRRILHLTKKPHSIRTQSGKVMDLQDGRNTALIFNTLERVITPQNGPKREASFAMMHLGWHLACIGIVGLLLM